MPPAPRKPDEDKQFQSVKGQVKRSARQQRHHEKTDVKVQQAKDASALDEASQKQEDAKIRRTGELENTGAEQKRTYRFDAEKFKTELLKRLRSVLPKDEDQAKEFPKSNKLEGVKAEVSGSVAREKEVAVGRMDGLITPDPPGGQREKPDDVKVPDPVLGARPPQIDPKLAVAKPKTSPWYRPTGVPASIPASHALAKMSQGGSSSPAKVFRISRAHSSPSERSHALVSGSPLRKTPWPAKWMMW